MNSQKSHVQRKNNQKREYRVPLTIIFVIFFLFSLTLLFPLLWLLYNAVKDKVEFFLNPWNFPQSFWANLKNFGVIFSEFGVGKMFFNSIFIAVLSPIISIFFTACAAYAYARHTFKTKPLLYIVAMIPMVVSVAGTEPATYRLVNNLGIYDSLPGMLLLSTGGFGFNFLLLVSVFVNISGAYKEAAQIDGAGNWRIFLTIYLPQASGILSVLMILGFIGAWNDYTMPYLYLPSHETLATGIYTLSQSITGSNSEYSNDYPKLFAAMIVSIMPVLVLFIAFQDKIMHFSLGGGVKG